MLGSEDGGGFSRDHGREMLSSNDGQTMILTVGESNQALRGTLPNGIPHRRSRRRRAVHINTSTLACALLAGTFQTSMAQGCISLEGSKTCPAFNASSISTNDALVGFYPFLATVSDLDSFDSGLRSYISDGYAQIKYQQLLGCPNFDTDNTTDFYARYTTSTLCSEIVQNSIEPCGLTGNAARPLCADSCAAYAESEQEIAASNICGSAGPAALDQIRSDFTICALPADSLTGQCVEAVQNQPDNCGFASNLGGLCSYCAASSPNSTDSCCVFSQTEDRCKGVNLPIVATSALQPITMTASSQASGTGTAAGGAAAGSSSPGLTGGQIAGIVVGSVLGALVLLGLLVGGCLLLRRRKEKSPATSVFNQPTPSRQREMSYHDGARDPERGLTALPPARVARMSALEGGNTTERKDHGRYGQSTTDDEDSPESGYAGASGPPPMRSGSLSSASQLAVLGGAEAQDTSPSTNNEDTSPESQGQSEQLGFFKDYYSQDEIHPGDLVATLWAYEPRAADEFHLERGDMIKVIGIWDDGWATGIRVRQRADDWRPDGKVMRDSGLSNGGSNPPDTADGGEVKAFPLVCVCLPQHWRKTIEGESTEGSGPPDIP